MSEHLENPQASGESTQTDTSDTGSFEKSREESRTGGANTEAYQIASALYGGHPPAEYVEKVREGLQGEDH